MQNAIVFSVLFDELEISLLEPIVHWLLCIKLSNNKLPSTHNDVVDAFFLNIMTYVKIYSQGSVTKPVDLFFQGFQAKVDYLWPRGQRGGSVSKETLTESPNWK